MTDAERTTAAALALRWAAVNVQRAVDNAQFAREEAAAAERHAVEMQTIYARMTAGG